MKRPIVIVWGADNYNSLGVLRQISKGDFDVLFLLNGSISDCATQSRYCTDYVHTSNYKEGVKYLLETFEPSEEKPILIPTGDLAAEAIDDNKSLLEERFRLMGTSEKGLLRKVDDKNYMTAVAKECGLTVPQSFEFTAATDNYAQLPFPCILKPTIGQGIKEFKTKIIKSENDLRKFQKILNPKNVYILQQLIPKQYDVLVCGCRFKNGETKYAGQFIKDRWSDDGGGSHGLLTPELPSYLQLNEVTRLLEKIDYKGLFSVEYGLVGDTAYFYEVNLRNDGTSHLFFQAGANLPLAWCYDCLDIDQKISTCLTRAGWNQNECYDIINVFRGRISYSKYKLDKSEASIFHYYSPDDPKPWKVARRKAIWDIPFRAFLLKFRPMIVHLKNKLGR